MTVIGLHGLYKLFMYYLFSSVFVWNTSVRINFSSFSSFFSPLMELYFQFLHIGSLQFSRTHFSFRKIVDFFFSFSERTECVTNGTPTNFYNYPFLNSWSFKFYVSNGHFAKYKTNYIACLMVFIVVILHAEDLFTPTR